MLRRSWSLQCLRVMGPSCTTPSKSLCDGDEHRSNMSLLAIHATLPLLALPMRVYKQFTQNIFGFPMKFLYSPNFTFFLIVSYSTRCMHNFFTSPILQAVFLLSYDFHQLSLLRRRPGVHSGVSMPAGVGGV